MEENNKYFDTEISGMLYTINELSNIQVPAYLIKSVGIPIASAIQNLTLIKNSIEKKIKEDSKENEEKQETDETKGNDLNEN